tara:strand:- start:1799 stop:1966 length:168 start_codon:yes stop_codon:yes gene_type:complete
MRTQKEISEIVEKTIKEIRKSKTITDNLISKTCLKYDINENHVRTVAGWKNKNIK